MHPAKKIKNKTFATPVAATETPLKPKNPAIKAMTKKIAAHFSIFFLLDYFTKKRRGKNFCAF
jgi:hypothetical protein